MNVHIDYRTIYRYSGPVAFLPHEIRVFPRLALDSHLATWEFTTVPASTVTYRRDLYDNVTARCFFEEERSPELRLFFEADLEVGESNPFDFLLEPDAERLPFSYPERHAHVLDPFLTLSPEERSLPLPAWADPPRGPGSPGTVETLTELVRAMRENIGYERRAEGDPRDAGRTLALSRGACRDFSVLLAVILRRLGLACRLASGYLLEPAAADAPRTADQAFHAWVEVLLPGAGWIPLDATNGIFGTHHHIGTAVGLTAEDIAPVTGSFFGPGTVRNSMHMSLNLEIEGDSQNPRS